MTSSCVIPEKLNYLNARREYRFAKKKWKVISKFNLSLIHDLGELRIRHFPFSKQDFDEERAIVEDTIKCHGYRISDEKLSGGTSVYTIEPASDFVGIVARPMPHVRNLGPTYTWSDKKRVFRLCANKVFWTLCFTLSSSYLDTGLERDRYRHAKKEYKSYLRRKKKEK